MTHQDEQLSLGVEVEAEHLPTYDRIREYYENEDAWPPDELVWQWIAEDHLAENPAYYTWLVWMEKLAADYTTPDDYENNEG